MSTAHATNQIAPDENLTDLDTNDLDATDAEATVHGIHSGALSVADIPIEHRRQCVAHLAMQGFTSTDIAQVMRMNERTVRRDRAAIRREEAILPDKHLGDELLGEYQRYVHAGVQRLTRRASDNSEPAYVRLWAEEAITRMLQRFIDTVHKLNYLRDGSKRVQQQVALDTHEQEREIASFEASQKLFDAKNILPKLKHQKEVFQKLKEMAEASQKKKAKKQGATVEQTAVPDATVGSQQTTTRESATPGAGSAVPADRTGAFRRETKVNQAGAMNGSVRSRRSKTRESTTPAEGSAACLNRHG